MELKIIWPTRLVLERNRLSSVLALMLGLSISAAHAQITDYCGEQKHIAKLALQLHVEGKKEESKALLSREIAKAPKAPATGELYRAFADLYCAEKNLPKALDQVNKALSVERRGKTYTTRGTLYQAMGKRKEAEADFKRAIDMGGEGKSSYDHLVRFYVQDHQYQKAIDVINDRMKKNGADDVTYHYRAEIEMMAKRYDEALRDYIAALKLDDASYVDQVGIGDVYVAKKNYKAALAAYTAALNLRPLSVEEIYLKRANVYDVLGKPDLAKKDRESAK